MVDTKSVAQAKVRRAMQLIEHAQHTLAAAAQELSPIVGAIPDQDRIMKLYDRVHREWYHLRDRATSRAGEKWDLDGDAKERLLNELGSGGGR